MKFEFETLKFVEKKEFVRAELFKLYYFDISKKDLERIGSFNIKNESIIFSERIKPVMFENLLSKGFESLTSKITGKKTLYIHSNSGIPLFGTTDFGIIDRGTSLIELKPLTGCNMNCIFCSVDEGRSTKKIMDVLIEREYLIQELKKIVEIKKHPVEVNINPQGEPLLYPEFIELVKDMKKIRKIKRITMNTNGVLLHKKLIDELQNIGFTRINFSINALDQKLAEFLEGEKYSVEKIMKMIEYSSKKLDVHLSPVWLPGLNDQELDKLIRFSKKLKIPVYFQNFLENKAGRNPVKQASWNEFYNKMKSLEEKHKIKLIVGMEDFQIVKDETFEKPFRKNEIVSVELFSQARHNHEAYAKAKGRIITVLKPPFNKGILKVKILRIKHDIYKAIPL